MTHHPSLVVERAVARSSGRPALLLVLLCAAQFMLILDVTVVNVALPSIQDDVGLAVPDLHWLVTAYTLAFGGLLILGGRAGDLFGRRRMFLLGLSVFTLASLLAALAPSPGLLVAARVAQGVGAALLSPSALALIPAIFAEGHRRNRALAVWAAVAASGGAIGVLVGGLLTEAFGWQAIFLVNVPVGAAIGALAFRYLPTAPRASARRLDLRGAVLSTTGLAALIYGLSQAGAHGWASGPAVGPFALAGAALGGFLLTERAVPDPLVPLSVFRRRSTVAALVLMILGMGPVFAGFFLSSLYLQTGLGHSPLRTGLEFLPVAAVIVGAAHTGGHLVPRIGSRTVIALGLTIGAVGGALLSRLPVDGSYLTDLLPGFLMVGAGGGLAAAGVMVTAMSGVGPTDAGLVSGLTNTAHELSITLTLPVLSVIIAGHGALGAAGEAFAAGPLIDGIANAFLATGGMALVGAVLAMLLLPRGVSEPAISHSHGLH